MRRVVLMAALLASSAPAIAADDMAAAGIGRVATQLNQGERDRYRQIFAAIDGKRWAEASALVETASEGPLKSLARAELYTAAGSPRVELPQLTTLLTDAPQLPQSAALARLALARGATALPAPPTERRLTWLGSAPIRARATPQRADAAGLALAARINPLIVDNRPAEAEALVIPAVGTVTPEALTEAWQRVAWSYYIVGDDVAARRVASLARAGVGRGEWAVQADWVAGLAAWRQRDYTTAETAFDTVAARGEDAETRAAGGYWSARAALAAGRPQRVEARLRTAARSPETFYGLIAAKALGMADTAVDRALDFSVADRARLERCANSRAAMALVEIGQERRAGELLRHQARIGDPAEHGALLRLAHRLDLPEVQLWLAHNGPQGVRPVAAARYPAPRWTPTGGWRVDRSLVFAHTLQESRFRADVVSPAGAHGLMQVRPGTAGDIARARGTSIAPAQLFQPATNIEFGQSYIEHLRDMPQTGGLLPKVIAAFNAGPQPVGEWNARGLDRGDPLLYIESMPYWETRGYVPIVMRNYWMYQRQAGEHSASLGEMAQGRWPRFPGSRPRRLAGAAEGVQTASAD